jgi:hypothetical protein
MLYKGPTEQEIRLLNQHGAGMKRHRQAVSRAARMRGRK